jgi:hypothetical protein
MLPGPALTFSATKETLQGVADLLSNIATAVAALQAESAGAVKAAKLCASINGDYIDVESIMQA